MENRDLKKKVRERYGKIARTSGACCGGDTSCCSPSQTAKEISRNIGYSRETLETIPGDANMGLGCGNPTAIASLEEGDAVLDLGSGGGMDCFLAARKVGKTGNVVGVDMTPEMVEKARRIAAEEGYDNVEFRLGEIENIPADNNTFDVVISNCVINLSPDKSRVFEEVFRVLKPGGRMVVSDIVLLRELPERVRNSIEAYTGCIAGALLRDDYLDRIAAAGFSKIEVAEVTRFPTDYIVSDSSKTGTSASIGLSQHETAELGNALASMNVRAVKS
jgi:SAM-dependent methyltransferase